MRVVLVGADVEENLGMGMVGAALAAARHRVEVVPFNNYDELDAVMARLRAARPGLIGLGMQFQHRARDFVMLARGLRAGGFRGHLTAGGQYATLAADELVSSEGALDSVVLHEGETTVVDLVGVIERGGSLAAVPGLVVRGHDGAPQRTAPRPLHADLDALPFARRYRRPTHHLGVPFFPVWGSRGCWGACTFCGISTYYRDARAHGAAGRKLRLRSVESLADEMAALSSSVGGVPSIFCFHDDTFLLPRPEDSLTRVRGLREALDVRGVGKVGIVGKCRPECVTPELARELRGYGVFRLYVGVENASQHGQDDLNRRTRTEELCRALAALRSSGVFGCYNLLVFEPDTIIDDVRENLAFMREHTQHPVNFCRAEPYHKTPLYERVRARGTLGGSHLGWDYRIGDDRAELLYRIVAAAFHERNFDAYGVANRYMGLGYMAQVLETFYDVASPRGRHLLARTAELIREVTLDTATHLELAIELASGTDLADRDRIERETARLSLRISAHDRLWHAAFDDLIEDMTAFVTEQRGEVARRAPARALRGAVGSAALVGAMSLGAQACGGRASHDDHPPVGDPPPSGGTGGYHTGGTGGTIIGDPPAYGGSGGYVYDMLPTGAFGGMIGDPIPTGGTGGTVDDPLPDGGTGGFVSDPLPTGGNGTGGLSRSGGTGGLATAGAGGSDASTGGYGGYVTDDLPSGGFGGFISDMVPDGGMGGSTDPLGGNGGLAGAAGAAGTAGTGSDFPDDPLPSPGGMSYLDDGASPADGSARAAGSLAVVDAWRSTAPRRARRSEDLPFFAPPEIRLHARRVGDRIEATLVGGETEMSIRWEGEGVIEGAEREIRWRPVSPDDQLRVGVRTRGGVAVATLRAKCVRT
ncbi:MAG: radical SAM protein [Polyangiaceae bacterium]|nr:radical SAM protein [Polyangiaceae bacterium]